MKIVCSDCKRFFRCIKIGVIIEDKLSTGETCCYWHADMYQCINCKKKIFITADKSVWDYNGKKERYEVIEKLGEFSSKIEVPK